MTVPLIPSVAWLERRYPVWFVDIWGVLHDGIAAHAPAVAACLAHRAGGGVVVLISNSPRPSAGVMSQMHEFGVAQNVCDAVVTSGDITMALLDERAGQRVHHVGPARDLGIFAGAPVIDAPLAACDFIALTGLIDDETETLADYAPLLAEARARALPMICANPDLWVERGQRLIPCAGLIAEDYARRGGTVVFAGKPYAPIYDRACALAAAALGRPVDTADMLAIGDGIATDITGAARRGIAAVYVASAVSAGAREAMANGDTGSLFRGMTPPIAIMAGLAP